MSFSPQNTVKHNAKLTMKKLCGGNLDYFKRKKNAQFL